MRDLKFRAWDEENKRMVLPIALDNEGRGIKPGYQWWSRDNNLLHAPIMQYTGLTDKNGKEIYEGDIVTDGNYNYTVVFYGGSWCLRLGLESGSYHSLYPVSKQREVVGNIYENPKLLTEVNE